MKNFNKKPIKTPLIFSIIILLLATTSFFVLRKEIQSKDQRATEFKLEAENEFSKKENATTLVNFVEANEANIEEIDKFFVYQEDVVPFLQFVESLGVRTKSDVEVSSVEVAKDDSNLFVGIDIEGSFESVYKFIKLLENAPYKVEILDLNIRNLSTGAGEDSPPSWRGNIRVRIISFLP